MFFCLLLLEFFCVSDSLLCNDLVTPDPYDICGEIPLAWSATLCEWMKCHGHHKILNVGATKNTTKKLYDMYAHNQNFICAGLNHHKALIDQARTTFSAIPRMRWYCGDVCNFVVDDTDHMRSCSGITSFNPLYWLDHNSLKQTIQQCASALECEGKVYLLLFARNDTLQCDLLTQAIDTVIRFDQWYTQFVSWKVPLFKNSRVTVNIHTIAALIVGTPFVLESIAAQPVRYTFSSKEHFEELLSIILEQRYPQLKNQCKNFVNDVVQQYVLLQSSHADEPIVYATSVYNVTLKKM